MMTRKNIKLMERVIGILAGVSYCVNDVNASDALLNVIDKLEAVLHEEAQDE